MRIEELYPCTKAELLEKMKALAASYTPEWKLDEKYPDAGTVLAMLYADMFYDTVCRYNRIPEKNQAAFFRSLGAQLKPAVPASGYICFSLSSDEFGGTEVPAGFPVTAQGEGEDSNDVFFETQDSVYATPSRLETVFLIDGGNDRIQCIYEDREEVGIQNDPIYLFQSDKENRQEHVLTLIQEEVLNLKGPAQVCLQITPYRFQEGAGSLDWLLDEKQSAFEYYAEGGYISFGKRFMENDRLILDIGDGQPPLSREEADGQEGYRLRCRYLKPYVREDFTVEELRLTSRAGQVAPDVVQTEAGEEELNEVYPFGERPMLYSEVYIASEQVLSKSGARVTMSFRLDYEKTPLDAGGETERNWKLVMKREDFKPDPEYDITIERVIWEYYNGTGWSRLFDGPQYGRIFNGGDGTMGQQFTLEFTCRGDAKTYLYNSTESRYIRIRVLKMNNLFKMKGNYITPVMSDILFSFDYKGRGRAPDSLETLNNMVRRPMNVGLLGQGKVCWPLFQNLGCTEKMLYLKFTMPFKDGPIRILFTTEETVQEELPRLAFEYYTDSGFKPLPVMDETQRLRKSGVITFMGRPDFGRTSFWGEEGCWLRIIDAERRYRKITAGTKMPAVNGIYMNASRVLAVRTMPEERFRIEPGEENQRCTLLNQNVYGVMVWVDEGRSLTEIQQKRAAELFETEEERGEDGRLLHFWIKWVEKEDFYLSEQDDRHYTVDRMKGIVSFSDGRNGKIPSSGDGETVRIRYTCGGGEDGNQPERAVSQMTRTLGYINRVFNPCITAGGSSQETSEDAVRRSARALCHGDRAVTAWDYEALAMEASGDVLKVKCFPNCNEQGAREPGSVTLVVLQRQFRNGRIYFDKVRAEVESYIRPRIGGNQEALRRFYVAEPRYLELRCRLELVVGNFNEVFDVRRRIQEKIEEFLDPITGNYDRQGWSIGRIPNEIQITNAIKGIPGIRYMNELRMSAFMKSPQGWIEVDAESVELRRFAVALSGTHWIVITVES